MLKGQSREMFFYRIMRIILTTKLDSVIFLFKPKRESILSCMESTMNELNLGQSGQMSNNLYKNSKSDFVTLGRSQL